MKLKKALFTVLTAGIMGLGLSISNISHAYMLPQEALVDDFTPWTTFQQWKTYTGATYYPDKMIYISGDGKTVYYPRYQAIISYKRIPKTALNLTRNPNSVINYTNKMGGSIIKDGAIGTNYGDGKIQYWRDGDRELYFPIQGTNKQYRILIENNPISSYGSEITAIGIVTSDGESNCIKTLNDNVRIAANLTD